MIQLKVGNNNIYYKNLVLLMDKNAFPYLMFETNQYYEPLTEIVLYINGTNYLKFKINKVNEYKRTNEIHYYKVLAFHIGDYYWDTNNIGWAFARGSFDSPYDNTKIYTYATTLDILNLGLKGFKTSLPDNIPSYFLYLFGTYYGNSNMQLLSYSEPYALKNLKIPMQVRCYTKTDATSLSNCWSATTATGYSSELSTGMVANINPSQNNYYINRSVIIIDTRNISNDLNIANLYIKFIAFKYAEYNCKGKFILQYSTDSSYPHLEIDLTDYNKTYYTGNCGELDGSKIKAPVIKDGLYKVKLKDYLQTIQVNETGLSHIVKGGYTKYMLRYEKDVDETFATDETSYFIGSINFDYVEREVGDELYFPGAYVEIDIPENQLYKIVLYAKEDNKFGIDIDKNLENNSIDVSDWVKFEELEKEYNPETDREISHLYYFISGKHYENINNGLMVNNEGSKELVENITIDENKTIIHTIYNPKILRTEFIDINLKHTGRKFPILNYNLLPYTSSLFLPNAANYGVYNIIPTGWSENDKKRLTISIPKYICKDEDDNIYYPKTILYGMFVLYTGYPAGTFYADIYKDGTFIETKQLYDLKQGQTGGVYEFLFENGSTIQLSQYPNEGYNYDKVNKYYYSEYYYVYNNQASWKRDLYKITPPEYLKGLSLNYRLKISAVCSYTGSTLASNNVRIIYKKGSNIYTLIEDKSLTGDDWGYIVYYGYTNPATNKKWCYKDFEDGEFGIELNGVDGYTTKCGQLYFEPEMLVGVTSAGLRKNYYNVNIESVYDIDFYWVASGSEKSFSNDVTIYILINEVEKV